MKTKKLFFTAISLLTVVNLGLSTLAYAQDNVGRDDRQERRGTRQEERQGERQGERQETRDVRQQERQDDRQERRGTRQEERQAKRFERRRAIVDNVYQRMKTRLERRMTRMSEIYDLIVKKADELEGQGKDVSEARSYLSAAQTAFSAAKESLTAAGQKYQEFMATTDPVQAGPIIKEIQNLLRQAYPDLQEARKNAVSAVKSLRSIVGE